MSPSQRGQPACYSLRTDGSLPAKSRAPSPSLQLSGTVRYPQMSFAVVQAQIEWLPNRGYHLLRRIAPKRAGEFPAPRTNLSTASGKSAIQLAVLFQYIPNGSIEVVGGTRGE